MGTGSLGFFTAGENNQLEPRRDFLQENVSSDECTFTT